MEVLDVFKTLQQIDKTSNIPLVLLLENENSSAIINSAMNLPIDGILLKPISVKNLVNICKNIIIRRQNFFKKLKKQIHPLFDSPFVGVMKIHDQKIEYINSYFAKLLNYTDEELTDTHISKVFSHNTIMDWFMTNPENIELPESSILELRAIDNEGNHLSIHSHVSIINIEEKASILLTAVKNGNSLNSMEFKLNTVVDILLTKREEEILFKICSGYTNYEIAEHLCISERTVQGHRSRLMNKTNCRNSIDLIKFAIRNGLIDLN